MIGWSSKIKNRIARKEFGKPAIKPTKLPVKKAYTVLTKQKKESVKGL